MYQGVRYAIYFAPAASEPLWTFGSAVLGRDAVSGEIIDIDARLSERFPNWRAKSANAARYGFHATLKAPFELAEGVDERKLTEELTILSASMSPLTLNHLQVNTLGRFIALTPLSPPRALEAFAAKVVCSLDHLRAPLTSTERARRQPENLSERERELLDRWGYPYVLDTFRFHMTLTDALCEDERRDVLSILRAAYADIDRPVTIESLCVFKETARSEPFRLVFRQPLGK